MKADMVKKLVIMLMSQNKEMNMNDALSVVFNSDTYQKIMDEKAGLYYQSAVEHLTTKHLLCLFDKTVFIRSI